MKKAQIFSFCTIVFAILGIVLFVAMASVKFTLSKTSVSYSGLQVMFGVKDELNFSFLSFLGILFAIGGVVITLLPLAGIKVKLFPVIALACFVVAALFAFLSSSVIQLTDAAKLVYILHTKGLGIGSIIAGICYIVAACTSALPVILKSK